MANAVNINKKRKFVSDGVFEAELTEFLTRELGEDGFSGVSVRRTTTRTEVIISATNTLKVLGERGRRIRELTALIEKRFHEAPGTVECFVERVAERGLNAVAQAESLKYKLIMGLAVRHACYSVLRNIMEAGATGAEVIVSGKVRAQRAKVMKFVDGYLLKTGRPSELYTKKAVRHVFLRQGVLGIKVLIMLPHDPRGRLGPSVPVPDAVVVHEPKEDNVPEEPIDLLAAQRAKQAAQRAAQQAQQAAAAQQAPVAAEQQ